VRILHVTPSFYPAWAYGGVTRCTYELCRALAQRGEAVTVWTTDVLDASARIKERDATVDGIQVRHFRNLSNHLAYHRQLYLPRGLWMHARRHVRDFDLVHLHAHRHVLNTIVAAAVRRAGIPYVLSGHGTVQPIERYVLMKQVVDALGGRALLQRADACVAVAGAEVAHFRALGVDTQRVQVIPNGLRLDDYARIPPRGTFRLQHAIGDAPLILFVGKITPRKGVDVLLRALARLTADVHLVIAGNFMMPAEPIRQLARTLGVDARVRFVGFLPDEQKLAAYADADVVAYPSVHEIFGLVPFESLMCGTPVVVCDDSGCGEVLGAAGAALLVPYGDAQALADALQRFLGDPAFRRATVTRGRCHIEEYLGWDRVAERTVSLYREILERRRCAAAVRPTASLLTNPRTVDSHVSTPTE
jgi:glycosyltransferase involved in cell wall biosynthesis